MELQETPKHNQGGTTAELTWPARSLKKKIKNEMQKPQGRKAFHTKKQAKYHNWFTPFIFKQIENARIMAGELNWSTWAIEWELIKKDSVVFKNFRHQTLDEWIDRSQYKPRWLDKTLARIKHGNDIGHANGGRKGALVSQFCTQWLHSQLTTYQANHPGIVDTVKSLLTGIWRTGAEISLVTAQGIMLGTILTQAPDILMKNFADGLTFWASNSFMRHWLHDSMHWSCRKATQAAQKKPLNWEDLCEKSAFWKAHLIKEEDIPPELWVNSDQTQAVYAPGNKMTWAETGSKQVPVIGTEEKRAITILILVASDGTVPPMQVIYSGKTDCSQPSKNAPYFKDLVDAIFLLQESETVTYWSDIKIMKDFMNRILAPYFNKKKVELNLPPSQKSLWKIDIWPVHCSKEFCGWMRTTHPIIILNFVPGGCTSVAQPCDAGSEIVSIDMRLAVIRDRSVCWIWNAYQTIKNTDLVKKASNSVFI